MNSMYDHVPDSFDSATTSAPAPLSLVKETVAPPPVGRPYGLMTLMEAANLPPRDWLIDGLLARNAVGFFGGAPKVGKSWLALELALCVALGVPFLGHEVSRKGRVLYFLGEESTPDVKSRADRLLKGRGRTAQEVGDNLFLAEGVPYLEQQEHRDSLIEVVREMRPELVVFDPLERFLTAGDTNSSKEMRAVNNYYREELARRCQIGVIVVHHTDKKGHGLRGTGDFRAVSELTVLLGEHSGGSAHVKIEMRNARPPEPFLLTLQDQPDGSVRWARHTAASNTQEERRERAKALLAEASNNGLTAQEVQAGLKMRAADVKPLLLSIGAKPDGPNGRWILPGAPGRE